MPSRGRPPLLRGYNPTNKGFIPERSRKMHIHITPEARAYITGKGRQAIRLDAASHRSGGCSMALADPVLYLKPPKDPAAYHSYDADGITVYTSFVLSPREDQAIEIALQKVLGIRTLVVSGFDSLA